MSQQMRKSMISESTLVNRKNPQSKGPIKLTPSQLVQRQLNGNNLEDSFLKPQIKKFLNLADYSSYRDTTVPIDEPLFQPIPSLIQFTDYEPLQLKEKVFRLRNKDKVVRHVKILQPDSRLFQVQPAPQNSSSKNFNDEGKSYLGNKIAPGMEACFTIKFSPEAKIDYQYDLVVVTEREQFIVPIFAVGKRAMIDFPDILDFGACPVKYMTEKPIIIRNLGEKTTKWFLTFPQDFDADKKEGVLEQGKNEQIVIKFFPKEAKPYKNEVVLVYDKLSAYIPIVGNAQNHVVYLQKSFVQMDEAYIGLQSQQTVQIVNKSAVRVDFEWRAFSTEKEEQEKKNRLKKQLEEEEAEERMLLKEIVNNEVVNDDFEIENDDSDEDDRDEKAILQKRQKKAELMLARKYKDIRKAIEDDLLLFQDDIFSIEPISGSIWPNSEMTVTLAFQPKGAHSYTCPAFCNISCNQDRLGLNLQGDGIGPKAFLNQNEINLGDPFVNEEVRPTIVIENQGEIECEFKLLPNERHFGKMFKFFPERGTLKVGERREIKVEFSSSKPGEFKETFRWQLHGSSDYLSVLFIGHIRAPQFEFDREIIDYGKVSFNFPQQERLKLTNKSTVPFDFNLRIPGDGKMKDKEFSITPARGTIEAGQTIDITIEFTPRYPKKYEMVLTIDIEGVAQDMKCLTIKAESEVPQVEIKPADRLEFNEIFLRHQDRQEVQLINNSKLRAKFEVQEQKKESLILAKYDVEPSTGIIEPGCTITIVVKLITNKLGDITLPLGIVIVGSNNNLPHLINIVASSIGPIVEVSNNSEHELDFNSVNVLQDYSQKVVIVNRSKIEADFRAFTKNKISIFRPLQKHGLLKPSESMEIEVLCNADDAAKFSDVLHFVIKEGLDIDIALKAKGIGSTIFCKEDLTTIDFATLYTHRPKTREIFVENKGRKPQKLTWVRKQDKKKQQQLALTDEKNLGKSQAQSSQLIGGAAPQEDQDIFSIVPDTVLLPPKHGIMFQFRAYSTKPGKHPEQFLLNSVIGNDRKVHQLYTTTIDGEFIKPTLKFSEKKLNFKYTWEKDVQFSAISKQLDITSTSALPTNFILKYSPPFSISQESFSLQSGETARVQVDFDPGQKLDRMSGEQFGKLQIVHSDHPHREAIDLVGEVCFPNIKLESTTVNFGAILNETSKKVTITMTNVSEMGINYAWTFLEDELVAHGSVGRTMSVESKRSAGSGGVNASQQSSLPQQITIPINEVFDILPLSGYLEAGEVEHVEFVYNAFGGQYFKTTAICHVDGGPNYEVGLIGDSSLITYKISTHAIDLGELRFCDWVARDVYIENTGKVTFEYKVLLDSVKRKGYVDASPLTGRILGGEKQKITVKLCPVMPNEFKELIQIQVGYFEPDNITLTGRGFYPAILVNLDKIDPPEYKAKFDDEFEKKKHEREAQLKRAQLIARAAEKSPSGSQTNVNTPAIKSLEQISNEITKELDRQLFCTMINEQIEERTRQLNSNTLEDDVVGGAGPAGNTLTAAVSSSQLVPAQRTGMPSMSVTTQSRMNFGVENHLYEKIILTSYVCDFGNVVINSSKVKTVNIVNIGPTPLEINFDTRAARAAGFTMPERPPKVMPNTELQVKITYVTKTKIKYGKNKCIVPIEIKNGAKYNLELHSNITIPELTLENATSPDDSIDFGKVICGQRKTFFLRLLNDKEIPCQWNLNLRATDSSQQDKKKEEPKFTIAPNSGIIPSGSKQLVEITFSPTSEIAYSHKFTLTIAENTKPFHISVKGSGALVNLEFNPSQLSIGPVLPYDGFAHTLLEVTNPTAYPTELYSLDFDRLYLQEEETLASYEGFSGAEQLFVNVREPGQPLWEFIKKNVDKRKLREEIIAKLDRHEKAVAAKKEADLKAEAAAAEAKAAAEKAQEGKPAEPRASLKAAASPKSVGIAAAVDASKRQSILQVNEDPNILSADAKAELEKQLEHLSQVEKVVEFPEKVDADKLHHVVVMGHPCSGKTAAVKHLSTLHKRFIASIDESVDWAIDNNTAGGKKAKQMLEDKNNELENINAEREKHRKKAGKKSAELDTKWGPVSEDQFKWLSEEVIEECIRDRMSDPLCNAGLIFDGIQSKYACNHLVAMKSIMRAVGTQALQLVLFAPQVDEEGFEVWKLIEWDGMLDALKSSNDDHPSSKEGGKQGNSAAAAAKKKKLQQQQQANLNNTSANNASNASGDNFSAVVAQRKGSIQSKKDTATNVSFKKENNSSIRSQPINKSSKVKTIDDASKDSINEDEPALFEIFSPKDYEDGTVKELELKKIADIAAMMQNKFTGKIETPAIFDAVFDEGKKEEKKPVKKDAKGKVIVEEEVEVEVVPEVFDYSEILMRGPRIVSTLPLHYNTQQLFKSAAELIPAPVYPDPNMLPVPIPVFHQILSKPTRNLLKKKAELEASFTNKNFEILTPINNPFKPVEQQPQRKSSSVHAQQQQQSSEPGTNPDGGEGAAAAGGEDHVVVGSPQAAGGSTGPVDQTTKIAAVSSMKKTQKAGQQSVSISKGKPMMNMSNSTMSLTKRSNANGQQNSMHQSFDAGAAVPEKKYEFKLDELTNTQTRWVIPAYQTLFLVVRFFTKKPGVYEGKLEFENFFTPKRQSIEVKGHSDFPTISTLSKNLYWQTKKSRPLLAPDSYLSKVFISNENTFEFGPLVIGKNPEQRAEANMKKLNATTFRISNNGKYDANLQFALLSSVKEDDPEYKKGVFIIEPETMLIHPSDLPQELTVWAIPQAASKFKDEIIIMIKDNPMPVILPIQCLGSKPIVDIEEGGESVKFDRLLLKQNARKEIRIRNNGQINCKWRLTGFQGLPEEFSILNTEGELKPTQDTLIYVNFRALKQQKFAHTLQLEVEDVENLGIKQEVKTISVEAEAFDITVDLKFPDNNTENMLDFGAVRVDDIKDQTFTVKNIGLYPVQFSFLMKKKNFKDNFRIEPMKVQLDPGMEKPIQVRFQSSREVRMSTNNSNTDIIMEILEGKTLELYKPVPINVKVNSVFSKYSILPLKNMNFGPIQFNDSKTLTFEIKNEGLFEFNYTVFNYSDEEFRKQLNEENAREKDARLQASLGAAAVDPKDPKKAAKKEAPKQDKKPAKGGKGGAAVEGQLKIGQWAVTPSKGTVAPDSSVTVEVEFAGLGQKLYEQRLAVDVTGRDPDDQPNGILYETVAESCIPGINCDNFETIFEEQIIVASMNANQNITSMINSNVFFYEEKTFFFGTLIPSQHPDGIFEKFKIINPNKVPCTVKFDVRKRNATSTEPFAFEIATKTAKIHPHEHTYVKIFFKPTIMAQYSGIFEAIVENGEQNPKTHKLVFDLRGEGAMPTIKLEKPKEYFNESTPLLKFPKVRIDKACILPIVVKNDGMVPATVKWDLVTNESFRFLDQNSYTVTPKSYKTFNIEFKPREAGVKQWQIAMQTLQNPFEVTKFMIQGDGFYEDIVFEGLPDDAEDELNFGDCVTEKESKLGFYVKNNKNETVKFNWSAGGCEDFSFVPRVGHLGPKATKYVQVIFKGSKPTTHKLFPLSLETRVIKQIGTDAAHPFLDWDDSMKNVKYVTKSEYDWLMKRKAEEESRRKEEEAAAAAAAKKGAKKDGKQNKKADSDPSIGDRPPQPQPGEYPDIPFDEPVLEPENVVTEKSEKNIPLKVSAVSDYAKYEVDVRDIYFKPTLMYTSRTHTFKVKNTALIDLKYSVKIISYQDNVPIVDPGFFYITPKTGKISPNCDEQFSVRFSPTEVEEINERFLVFTIENMEKGVAPLVVNLEGEAERPVCHFELQPSSFREKKKPELDASYHVLEFDSLGTKVKNTRKFYVVNPTAIGYEFEWRKIDEDKLPAGSNISNESFFKCMTPKGVVLSGKKYEIVFEYTPDTVGTHESYWQFVIPSQKIVQNFLVVGSVIEPNVFFDAGKVNFGPLLLGGKNKEIVHLKNLEDVPMSFSFDKESVRGEVDYADSLSVTPISGLIKPQSEIALEIVFAPKVETSFNYNLLCYVKRKSRPVSLNVKGIGYILHHSVQLQQQAATQLDHSIPHLLNFGDIYVNEHRSKIIEISNSGEFNFDFAIKKGAAATAKTNTNLAQPHSLPYIQILPEVGTVKQNDKTQIEIKFAPQAETRLIPTKQTFTLNISSGPSYTFQLSGNAKKPGVELSFVQHDFGPQFVLKQPLPITMFLEMRNRDVSAMSIETTFEKTNYLEVNLPPGQVILPLTIETSKDKKGILQTKESNVLKIPITFTPRECRKYNETITFDINGLHRIDVKISGEGIPLKLELERTEDQNVDFGVVRVKSEVTRSVIFSNLSKKSVSLSFDNANQLAELAKSFISIQPSAIFTILPKERKEIELTFHPESRLHAFRKELMYKIVENQEQRKLLNVSGACHGIELKLMEDTIGFGVVVLHSKKVKQLQLLNLGDIGAKFEWDFSQASKHFSITPERGFLPPHEDSFFTITFHPNAVDTDIRFNKVRCEIEGSSPLLINLLGKCIPQPVESIQDIKFSTIVRTTTKSKVTVKNPSTTEVAKIKVSITSNNTTSNYFTGKEILEIQPNQSADYEVFYTPLTMTASNEHPGVAQANHEGTLFFPLPDGTALLYNLFGIATPPAPEKTFDITSKAKKQHMQIIPIQNWLKQTQRFQVAYVVEPADPALFISGANTFDVAGESHKDYKLSLYALKPTTSKITVTFKNPTTSEFVHFKINLTVQPPDAQEKIEMSAIIRETTTKLITVVNPLPMPIEIKKEMLTADNDNITFNPPSFTIHANSEFGFEIVYRPLLVKEEASKVTLNSTELGQFMYPLALKGVSQSTVQRNMTLKASLGFDITQSFKFTNYCKKQTTYACRVEKIGKSAGGAANAGAPPVDPKAKAPIAQVDFSVDQPSIVVPPSESYDGSEVSVNVRFEPSLLGESVSLLVISSAEGGEYTCMLHGLSSAPQPKGPYKIGGAKPGPIDFKNPFFDACEFTVRLDNPCFTTAVKNPVKIDGKKVLGVSVQYKAAPGQSSNGRLIIQTDKFDYPPWVFYLQGE